MNIFLSSVGATLTLNTSRDREAVHRAGLDRWTRVVNQAFQCSAATTCIQLATTAAGFTATPLTSLVVSVGWLAPIAIELGASQQKSILLQKACQWVDLNINKLSLTAVVVASLALVVFGHPISGTFSLGLLLLPVLRDYSILPSKVSDAILTGSSFIGLVLELLNGGYLYKFFVFITILDDAFKLLDKYFIRISRGFTMPSYPNLNILNLPSCQDRLNISDLRDGQILNPNKFTEIDRNHYLYQSPIPIVNISLLELRNLFNEFSWNDHREMIISKTADDERWILEKQDPIDYVRAGMQKFMERIQGSDRNTGSIRNDNDLQARVKWITAELQKLPEYERAPHLVNLALSSYFCPARYIEYVRLTFNTLRSGAEADSLQGRVMLALINERKRLFEMVFNELDKFFAKIDMSRNEHLYNILLVTFDDIFHLNEEFRDAVLDVEGRSFFDRFLTLFLLVPFVPFMTAFYENERVLFNLLDENQKNGYIPFSLLKEWFVEQYLEVEPATSRDDASMWVNTHVFDEDSGEIHSKYKRFLLIKMGVLKPNQAFTSLLPG